MQWNVEANAFFRTAETGMLGIDRPGPHIVEPQGRTVVERFRPFAAKFVEAVTLAMAFITKLLGKTACIKMRSPFTVFMD